MNWDRSKCEDCANCLELIEKKSRGHSTMLLVDCKVHRLKKALGPKTPPGKCKDYTPKGTIWTLDMSRPMDEWEWEEED